MSLSEPVDNKSEKYQKRFIDTSLRVSSLSNLLNKEMIKLEEQ